MYNVPSWLLPYIQCRKLRHNAQMSRRTGSYLVHTGSPVHARRRLMLLWLAGGVVVVPAGSFKVTKRLAIAPHKPFALEGPGPDISRLAWSGDGTEGISITPQGCLEPTCNDAAVKVSGRHNSFLVCCSVLLQLDKLCRACHLKSTS